ncbi:hypothetical protein CERSUDRAFT_75013 [Gelatoporia subvermispora B]|uniref:Uncharacterized protein n=1 Tax=Ceriporiopsis subvermispora (strain B) TaxID=914234 RepID=M2QTN5_CERS8|nr:hypothetical protein CERSUDRAFT_75013 [Gelatoporia subvermispora B]
MGLQRIDETDHRDLWVAALRRVWKCLDILHTLDFIHSIEIDDLLSFKEHYAFALFSYSFGASRFVHGGMPVFRQTLGDQGIEQFVKEQRGISICWVDNSPSAFSSPTRYRPDIRVRLQDEVDITGAWNSGDSVAPRVHPETQLITYLVREKIDILGNHIGLSKPACWACECYVDCFQPPYARRPQRRITDVSVGTLWKFSEVNGKFRDDWVPPPTPEGKMTIERMAHRLTFGITRRLDPVLYTAGHVWVKNYTDDQYDHCPKLVKLGPEPRRCPELARLVLRTYNMLSDDINTKIESIRKHEIASLSDACAP